MPELPELKVMRRQIVNHTIGKRIVDFKIYNLKLRGGEASDFVGKTIGVYLKEIFVLGKTLVVKLASSYYILANLQSTGFFVLATSTETIKNIRAEFIFADNSRLLFVDNRANSYFQLMNQKQLNQAMLEIGIDPLSKEFSYEMFVDLLRRRTASIKNLLTNDKVFLGLGKVYGNEICFEARVKPDKGIKELRPAEIKRIYSAIKKVPEKSLEYDGLSFYLPVSNKQLRFDGFLNVYNREGQKCRRCQVGVIQKAKTGQSALYFCPLCQP